MKRFIRRNIFKMLAVGCLSLGGAAVLHEGDKLQAKETSVKVARDEQSQTFTYKGRKLLVISGPIIGRQRLQRILIDGRELELHRYADGSYMSLDSPFRTYTDVMELGLDVVDSLPTTRGVYDGQART